MSKKIYLYLGILAVALIVLVLLLSPACRACVNTIEYENKKIDEFTDYDTLKKVEDTCRAYISSYTADKITYYTLGISGSEAEYETAMAAKMRANRTAAIYNEYYMKNSYVWKNAIPADIKETLDYIY